MGDRKSVALTRRSVLGAVVGLLATACSSAATRGSRANVPYPYPVPWCYSKKPKSLDILGKVIMQERNPYCELPKNSPCDGDNTDTWPMELTDETTYQLLTQFDYHPRKWQFDTGYTAQITRSMRIPYLIRHSKAQKPKKKIPQNVGFEHLLVGFEPTGSTGTATDWESDDTGCPEDSIGQLANFITTNMKPDGETSFAASSWTPKQAVEKGTHLTHWEFRRQMLEVEYVFRFPIETGTVKTATKPGRIYIGYEGGGAY